MTDHADLQQITTGPMNSRQTYKGWLVGSERTTTNTKATAFTAGVDGEGETQDDASEEESQTGVEDGAGSGLSSEGEGEMSEGDSECVRVSRDYYYYYFQILKDASRSFIILELFAGNLPTLKRALHFTQIHWYRYNVSVFMTIIRNEVDMERTAV